MLIVDTPEPPYVAVMFTIEHSGDGEGYVETDDALGRLVQHQPGFLGVETVDDGRTSISISYWRSEADARAWREVADHRGAQHLGRERWFRAYKVRVATVERDYGHRRGGGQRSHPKRGRSDVEAVPDPHRLDGNLSREPRPRPSGCG